MPLTDPARKAFAPIPSGSGATLQSQGGALANRRDVIEIAVTMIAKASSPCFAIGFGEAFAKGLAAATPTPEAPRARSKHVSPR